MNKIIRYVRKHFDDILILVTIVFLIMINLCQNQLILVTIYYSFMIVLGGILFLTSYEDDEDE